MPTAPKMQHSNRNIWLTNIWTTREAVQIYEINGNVLNETKYLTTIVVSCSGRFSSSVGKALIRLDTPVSILT